MRLKEAIIQTGKSYQYFARVTKMAAPSISNLANYGQYPSKRKKNEVEAVWVKALRDLGIKDRIEFPEQGYRPKYAAGSRLPIHPGLLTKQIEYRCLSREEIDLMQIDRNVLALFGLKLNPFLNDVESEEDVYRHKGYVDVTLALREAIDQRGFIAVCAESGAGKTTIWDGIEGEYSEREDVVICKPSLKQKEKLSPEHLCRALLNGLLGSDIKIPASAEDRGRMLSAALRSIRASGIDKKAVLYIDDAHFCSSSVLRQLKTFFEEKIGRYRLLTIILVGLPILKEKLALFPEIGNRIRICSVPPVPVKEYLDFKLKRAGTSIDKLFDAAGLEAFLDRFRAPRRPALGQPLIINAFCIRAMCQLYNSGAQRGERITKEIVDQLPGSTRRAA